MQFMTMLDLVVKISFFLTILGIGLRATTDDVTNLFRRPLRLPGAMIAVFVIMPLFVWLLARKLELDPMVELTLFALAVSPVPLVVPHRVLDTEERESFALGQLAAACVLSVFVIPFAFRIINAVFAREPHLPEQSIIAALLFGVLTPLVLGMFVGRFASSFADRYAVPIEALGSVLLVVGLLPILIAFLPTVWTLVENGTVVAIAAFTVVGIAAGHLLGGPEPFDRAGLAFATSFRHPAIVLALAIANLGGPETRVVAATVVLYVLVSGVLTVPYLAWAAREPKGSRDTDTMAAPPQGFTLSTKNKV